MRGAFPDIAVQITSFCLPELYNSVVETLNAAKEDSKAAVLSEYHADTNFDENKEIRASLFAEILSERLRAFSCV